MNNPKINIYKFLALNRLIVWALLVAFVAVCVIFSISLNRLYSKQLNTVLVLDADGEVIPMKWMDRLENIKIEVKNHLDKFHGHFYQFDSFNVERNLEKALWLGDNSVEQLYLKRSNDGWYNRIKMYNIVQSIEIKPEDIIVNGNDEPFSFLVRATLSIKQDDKTITYYFETTGNVIFVNRNYPLNPHGLLITNFNEINRQEVK